MPTEHPPTVSEATRRNIFDALTVENYTWSGRLSEPRFLGRLFDLEALPSHDARFATAEEDINKHRILNDDWENDWIFYDDRFNLLHCPDEVFFKFLSEMAHPVVQPDQEKVAWLIDNFNLYLSDDGWGMIKRGEISGRPIFRAQRLGELSPDRNSKEHRATAAVSKKTIGELINFLERRTLKEINHFFDASEFPELRKEYVRPATSQRRSLIDERMQSIKLDSDLAGESLRKLCEYALIQMEDDAKSHSDFAMSQDYEQIFENFLRWVKRDGFDFVNGRLTAAQPAAEGPEIKSRSPEVVEEAVKADSLEQSAEHPTAFVSYSWDSEQHKQWVRNLAARLRGCGVDVKLDRWELVPGDLLPHFMERGVSTNKFVLIVLTPSYKAKSDSRQGGVGYEGNVMTAEIFAGQDPRKFIPVLREGHWRESSPTWLNGKVGVDLRGDLKEQFDDLVATIHGTRETAPPLGPIPAKQSPTSSKNTPAPDSTPDADDPISILNIIASEVGTPRNDGTSGSALYAVPFQLSRVPSGEWKEHFIATWNRPPSWSTRHRPGIVRFDGDRLVLDGTTIDEVADVHRETLKGVLDKVNQDMAEHQRRQRQIAERKAEELRQHKKSVEDAAKRISFE